ncbi:MAG: BlaI/MecI/CopY family transcriptional regulator, partial [Sphingomonas sp.]
MSERISDAEHAVMEVLWDKSPLTAQEVSERIPAERDWSANTVKTLLGR